MILPIGVLAQSSQLADSWEEVLKRKSGTVSITWYTSTPFIYKDEKNNLAGIEYEIVTGFQEYLKEKHDVDLKLDWWENQDFLGTYNTIKNSTQSGMIGASAFSITPERQKEVAFTPPYMSDISVMISSYDVPIVNSIAEFTEVFNNLKAITIEGTTYAEDLNTLKKQYKLDFEIEYIPSIENVQQVIEREEGAFGFIDLPIYMTEFNRNSSVRVKRQNLFPKKRVGYSIILPLTSDWRMPLEQYFLSQDFQEKRDTIIAKYIDHEVYETIRNLYTSGNEDIFLLTKEKEIQNEALQGKTEQIKRETTFRKYLIACVGIVLFFLLIITRQYMNRHRSALLLQQQKEKIDIQRKAIETQKTALEKRNERLLELNEEKNNLIHILAHDLRSPINQMTGLTEILLMEKERLTPGQLELVNNIQSASTRLSGMIEKILDVDGIEKTKSQNTFETILLSSFIQEVVDRFKPDALKKGIDLKFYPKGSTPIQADPIHLTQIVENILSNALKFSNAGKNVFIHINESSQFVELRVQDEGPGFTEEDKRHMFKKFQRLSARPTGSESSTGLGLSIVKKYTDLMNAKIDVESSPGKGSTFIVKFQKT